MKGHKYKRLEHHGRKIAIDVNIVSLISKLWALGIETTSSCQDSCRLYCKHKFKLKNGIFQKVKTKSCYNHIWIAFASANDLEKFLNLTAEYHGSDQSMYAQMGCDRFPSAKYIYKDHWDYGFFICNNGVELKIQRPTINGKRLTYSVVVDIGCTKNNFVIKPQFTFPKEHLSYVEGKLDQALKVKK